MLPCLPPPERRWLPQARAVVRGLQSNKPYVEDDYGQVRKRLWLQRSHSANPSSLISCSVVPTAYSESRELDLTLSLVLPNSMCPASYTRISFSVRQKPAGI